MNYRVPVLTLAACIVHLPAVIVADDSDSGEAKAAGRVDVTYSLPRAAQVSLNILNQKGWIVRELLRADLEEAGVHTVHWDGNDDMDRPQPSGVYRWKLHHHAGLNADYVLSLGNSSLPPYRTPDDKGSWGAQRSCWLNMNNFKEAYYQASTNGVIQCDVDLDKKAWYPVAWWPSIQVGNQPYVFESHGRKFLYDDRSTLFVLNTTSDNWQSTVKFGLRDDGKTQVLSFMDLKASTQLNNLCLMFARFDPTTHESYLHAGSPEDSRIYHLTGFDSFQRLQGSVTPGFSS